MATLPARGEPRTREPEGRARGSQGARAAAGAADGATDPPHGDGDISEDEDDGGEQAILPRRRVKSARVALHIARAHEQIRHRHEPEAADDGPYDRERMPTDRHDEERRQVKL